MPYIQHMLVFHTTCYFCDEMSRYRIASGSSKYIGFGLRIEKGERGEPLL